MNYTQRGLKNELHTLNSKSAKFTRMFFLLMLKAFLVCCIAMVILGAALGIGVFKGILDSAPEITNVNVSPSGFLTFVYDREGNQTAKLVSESSNRIPVSMSQIPANLANAFVAIEDERFYEHNGIDIQGIIRAFVVGVKNRNFSEGASTLTQQLIKNNVFSNWTSEKSFIEKSKRKIQEQYLALELEKVMSKDLILENYMNTINLGQNTLGVQSASLRYFGKPAYSLTLSECTVIAAITQNPSRYNPISHPDENARRRSKVLGNMLDHEFITQAEYDEAIADNVYDRIQDVNDTTESDSSYTYFVDEVTEQVLDDLQKIAGFSETQAYYMLYSGGLKIYTTQDPTIQSICDEVFSNEENFPANSPWLLRYTLTVLKSNGDKVNYSNESFKRFIQESRPKYDMIYKDKDDAAADIESFKESVMESGDLVEAENTAFAVQPQVSITVEDQATGEILAVVGGRGSKVGSRTLNRATNTVRQPGSTFKVVAAYAPAFDSAGLTLANVFNDAPFNYYNGRPVKNWYGASSYRGLCTLRLGIQDSLNIIAVKTITLITPQLAYDYLINFGFTTISDGTDNEQGLSDLTQSAALGGLTNGVSNLELNAAYSCIANGGEYIKPRFYTQVVAPDGTVVLDNTIPEAKQVIKESTAFLLTDAMVDVVTKGTGAAVNFGGMAIAGKTGTTSSNKDLWFSGFTPYYTATVWTGYDNSIEMRKDAEKSLSKKLWRAVMSRLHTDLPNKSFPMPSGIVTSTVCRRSGKLPIPGLCSATLSTEYFATGTVPTDSCDVHFQGMVCAYSGNPASEDCPFKTPGSLELLPIEPPAVAAGSPFNTGNAPRTNLCPHNAEFFADPNYPAIIEAQRQEMLGRGIVPPAETPTPVE